MQEKEKMFNRSDYYSSKELMEMLGVSKDYLSKRRGRKLPPACRAIGSRYYYHKNDVKKFIGEKND